MYTILLLRYALLLNNDGDGIASAGFAFQNRETTIKL